MELRLFNAAANALELFGPTAPPLVDLVLDPPQTPLARARDRALAGALMDALVYLGYTVNRHVGASERADLCWGALAHPGALWLRPGPVEEGGLASGAEGPGWRLYCMGARYRAAWKPAATGLAAAVREWEGLRRAAESVAGARGQEPSARGLSVYLQKFQRALCADLDWPEAVQVLRDGLRPGALSAASQAALLREADAALGLGLVD